MHAFQGPSNPTHDTQSNAEFVATLPVLLTEHCTALHDTAILGVGVRSQESDVITFNDSLVQQYIPVAACVGSAMCFGWWAAEEFLSRRAPGAAVRTVSLRCA